MLDYRFGDVDRLTAAVSDIGEKAASLGDLSSDQLGALSSSISDALSIVSGGSLEEEDSSLIKRTISLNESAFERQDKLLKSALVDEVDDFFEIIEKNSHGAYVLIKEKTVEKGGILDLFS